MLKSLRMWAFSNLFESHSRIFFLAIALHGECRELRHSTGIGAILYDVATTASALEECSSMHNQGWNAIYWIFAAVQKG